MPDTPHLDHLLDRLADREQTPVFFEENATFAYATLAAAVQRLRLTLANTELRPGDVVGLAGDHGLDGTAWLLALAKHGAIVAPLAACTEEEEQQRLHEAGATWLVDATVCRLTRLDANPAANPLVEDLRTSGHPGLILFSSGTTGTPKAMLHDFERLLGGYVTRKERPLRMLLFLLFDHIGGLNTLFNLLAMGATGVVVRDRRPEAVGALLAAHRVSLLPATPTFLNLCRVEKIWERHDLSALKLISFGAEPMPPSLLAQLREALPRTRFLQTFGTSETGIAQTGNGPNGTTLLKLEDPHTTYKIVNGELWLRSATRALGYLNAANDRFTADGWFRTGDLCEEIKPGLLQIKGRGSEMINVGGEKVAPCEVESVLLEHPAVRDALVRGEAHPLTGQVVVATVTVAAREDPAALRTALRQHCATRLSRYKVPVKINFETPTGAPFRLKKSRPASSPA